MNLQNRLTSLVETHLEALQTLRKLKEQLDQDPDAPIDKSALKGALDTLVSEEVVDPFRGPVKIHNWKVRG